MNSPSWTPPASTGRPCQRNSTATPTGKPCAANGTTGGCRGSILGERPSFGENPTWSPWPPCSGETSDPAPHGTASCSTSTASGSTSTNPSTASTHGRTAFGAPAPTSSRRPARTLPTWWPAATPRCLTPPPTRGTPWSPWCASCRTTANPLPRSGRHDLRRDSRAAAEQPAHHR
jgi:hypothetical protein